MRPLLSAIILFAPLAISLEAQQTTDPNPGHTPDVFLDNHRPLLNKKQKAPTSRVVSGKVTDDTGQPLAGALVTITDTKTNDKRTYITKADGRYSFEDLSFTIDYQVQARYKDQISESRKLSQYDHTPNVIRILQVGPVSSQPSSTEARKVPPSEGR